MLRLVLCGMSCGFPSVVWICAFWINEREMWEMGDERKVKWQFLEERERMEKYFQEGFQLRMTVYRRGESNVQTCAGYPIGY